MSTTYQPVTRAAIDRAEPLEFNERKPARNDLTITITAVVDGFPVEVCFTGALDQLEAITRRLRDMGASPAGVHQLAPVAAPSVTRQAAQRVEPVYNGAGEACCPVHLRPLQPGQYGSFCSAKAKPGEAANAKGYCSLKFAE